MFHFTLPKTYDKSQAPSALVSHDADFDRRVFASWRQQTADQLAPDLYPLTPYDIMKWDGPTPNSHELCKSIVEASFGITPDYVWIDEKVRSFRESAVWDNA